MITPRVLFLDIETGPSEDGDFAPPERPTGQVLAWAVHDNYTNTIYSCVDVSKTDKKLDAEYLTKVLADPDRHLAEVMPHTKSIEPYTGKLITIPVTSELSLYRALEKVFDALEPDIVSGHNVSGITVRSEYRPGFDREYLLGRALYENRRRTVYNKKSRKNQVELYPTMLKWLRDKRGKRVKGIPPYPRSETIWFDGMVSYQLMHEGELEVKGREALGVLGERELGYGKILHPPMMEMAENDPNLLALYNIWDVVLSMRLNEKVGLINYYHTLARKVGIDIDEALHSFPVSRGHILHQIHGEFALPAKYMEPWSGRGVKGGYVAPPANGEYENVLILDNSGEYPSIVRTLNIDKTTKARAGDPNCSVTPDGNHYRLEPRGIIPAMMDQLAADRAEHQDAMKVAEYGSKEWKYYKTLVRVDKEIMNSCGFGVYANEHYQLRDEDIANDITKIARDHVKWNWDFVEKTPVLGYTLRPFYIDTDSVMCEVMTDEELSLEDFVKIGKETGRLLNESFDEFVEQFGVTEHYLHIKLEEVDEVYYQYGAKKRYAKLVAWDGRDISDLPVEERVKIKGFETRRSNASPLTKRIIKQALHHILTKNRTGFHEYMRDVVKEIKEAGNLYAEGKLTDATVLEELGTPMGLGTMETNKTTQQAKAAHYYNQYINPNEPLRPSDKARVFLGTVGPNKMVEIDGEMIPAGSFCLRFGDSLLNNNINLDIDGLLEKCVWKPLTNAGIDIEQCKEQRQVKLW